MKPVSIILSAILFSVLAAFATVKVMRPDTAKEFEKESVYDRVMRTGVVHAGYYPWPTYFDVDPNTKKLTGSSVELCDAVFRMLGLKVEYVEISANLVQDLETGKIDTRCADSPWALQSVKFLDYTSAFYNIPGYFFVREDETRFSTLVDMDKKEIRLIGLDGDVSTEYVQNRLPAATLMTYPLFTDPGQLMLNIASNKADAMILDPVLIDTFNSSNNNKLKMLFPDKPLMLSPIGFSVKKGEDKWFRTLDYGVQMAHHFGLIEPILQRYDPSGKKLVRIK